MMTRQLNHTSQAMIILASFVPQCLIMMPHAHALPMVEPATMQLVAVCIQPFLQTSLPACPRHYFTEMLQFLIIKRVNQRFPSFKYGFIESYFVPPVLDVLNNASSEPRKFIRLGWSLIDPLPPTFFGQSRTAHRKRFHTTSVPHVSPSPLLH